MISNRITEQISKRVVAFQTIISLLPFGMMANPDPSAILNVFAVSVTVTIGHLLAWISTDQFEREKFTNRVAMCYAVPLTLWSTVLSSKMLLAGASTAYFAGSVTGTFVLTFLIGAMLSGITNLIIKRSIRKATLRTS